MHTSGRTRCSSSCVESPAESREEKLVISNLPNWVSIVREDLSQRAFTLLRGSRENLIDAKTHTADRMVSRVEVVTHVVRR